jgi:hypothetical protein
MGRHMVVLDINTKKVIEKFSWCPGHVYWSTLEGWAQYKLDMVEFGKAMKVIEDVYWYGA